MNFFNVVFFRIIFFGTMTFEFDRLTFTTFVYFLFIFITLINVYHNIAILIILFKRFFFWLKNRSQYDIRTTTLAKKFVEKKIHKQSFQSIKTLFRFTVDFFFCETLRLFSAFCTLLLVFVRNIMYYKL